MSTTIPTIVIISINLLLLITANPLVFTSKYMDALQATVNGSQQIEQQLKVEQANLSTLVTNSLELDTEIVEIQNETCTNSDEEFVSPVRGTPRCCRKCEIGNGMLRLCTNFENTQCRPCKSGSEFSIVRSATKKCLQCRQCKEFHPLARTRVQCTPSSDTICECEKSYYISEKEQSCKPCSVCKPGEGVIKPCNWNSDTQCQACPTGFWSAKTIDNVKCIPCQICRKHELTVKSCSSISDTICCPINDPNCTYTRNLYFNYPDYDKEMQSGERVRNQNQMLPIYCSFMGLIIVSLLAYVIYKLWKQREAMAVAKLNETYTSGPGYGKDSAVGIGQCGVLSACATSHNSVTDTITTNTVLKQKLNITHSPQTMKHKSMSNQQSLYVNSEHEKEPLINNRTNLNSPNSDNKYDVMNQELNQIPIKCLASVCKQLATSGVCETTAFKKLKPKHSSMNKLNHSAELLLTTAMEETTDGEVTDAHIGTSLRTTCYLIQHLRKQSITVGDLFSYLTDANRSDLVVSLQTALTNRNED